MLWQIPIQVRVMTYFGHFMHSAAEADIGVRARGYMKIRADLHGHVKIIPKKSPSRYTLNLGQRLMLKLCHYGISAKLDEDSIRRYPFLTLR
jgi:hypothetical protein